MNKEKAMATKTKSKTPKLTTLTLRQLQSAIEKKKARTALLMKKRRALEARIARLDIKIKKVNG